MTVSSANRTALFIDGANLYSTAKALGFDIDYKRLLKEFQSHGTLVRAFYYTAVTEDQEFSSVRPLLDWLDYNGCSPYRLYSGPIIFCSCSLSSSWELGLSGYPRGLGSDFGG